MATYQKFDWYDDPIYYDIIFDDDTPREVAFLERVHERFVDTGGRASSKGRRVLEPACGTGRLIAALAQRGFRVAGFDISEPVLRFARQRLKEHGVRARLTPGAMERFACTARFDMAYCLVSTFKYLLTESEARSHLRCIARVLQPGGVYVLGFHISEYRSQARTRERWVSERDGMKVVCNIQSWPPNRRTRTEQVRSRFTVHARNGVRRYETHWTFRAYSVAQMKQLLRSVPELEHIATYNFGYDVDQPIRFDGAWLDNVLILRKKKFR